MQKGGKPMKKCVILVITILLLSIIMSAFMFEVQAGGLGSDLDAYKQSSEDNSKLLPIGNTVVWIIRVVGTSISGIMLLIIGIKYIMGSVEEKAEYKQTMWPYIVGAFLLFGGSTLTNIIYQLLIT